MSSNQKQQPSVVSQSQTRYVQATYLPQRPPTPQRTDGYHVGTPPAYVQQQQNQVNNQVQPLRGMPPTGPPAQASTPPNSDLKVQTMSQQPMNIAYVPQGQLRTPGQASYYRPTPPTNQNRMANQRQGQQAIYPHQPQQFVSMSIPHTPVYINAPAVPYYNNTPRPATNFVSSSYQVIAGQHLSGYSYAAQPPTQPQPQYYYNAAMMPRPQQQVAPAPQNAAQPPPTANIPIPQPIPQHGTHTKHKRRSNAIPIIDPSTGRDRLNEMYEQEQDSSHPPSGESSARQTPQPLIPNKELQATFAKQVAQAINEDEVAVVEELDQPPIIHEHVQIYPLPPQTVHPRIDIVQASKLQPATKEFVPASLAKEVTPVVSAITDAVEVTITNKSSKDRESPAKSRKQREQQHNVVSRDTKEQVKDALPISKDSSISVNTTKEEIKQKDVVVNLPTNKDIAGNSQRDESKKSIKKDKIETKTSVSVNPTEEDVADSTSVIQSSIPDNYYQAKSKSNASQKIKEASPKQNAQSTSSVVTPTPVTTQKPIQPSGNASVPVKQQQVDKVPSKSNKSRELNSKDSPKETTDIDAYNDNIVIDNSTIVAPISNISNNTNHSNDNSISTMEFVNNTNNIMLNNNIELTAAETPEESQEILSSKPVVEAKPIVKKINVTDIVVEVAKPNIAVTTAPFNNIAATSAAKATEPKGDTDDVVINTENDLKAETADPTETPVIIETKPDLPYSTHQWTPWKKDGLKVYAREFLLAMSKYQASLKKPENLPGDILKMDQGRVGDISRFSMGNRSTDFAPNFGNNSYPNKSSSQRGPIGKRNSQKGPLGSNGKAGGPNNNKPPVRYTVSLKNDIKLNEADNAWKPARFAASGELSEDEKKTAELYKRFRGILNKLTPQKFDTLMTQVQDLNIDTSERLQGIIDLVFEKAVDEPKFGSAYSSLCRELAMMQVPLNSGEGPEEFVNFRKLLVTRCQVEFEKSNANEKLKTSKVYEIENCPDPDKRKELQTELEENERQLRRKSVGTIRFIGELFKQQMLTVSIMLRCLKELLQAKDEESLECLCKLLATVGEILDNTKQTDLNMIFNEMRDIVEKRPAGISSRIRFMLQDSIELRLSSWVPRRLDSAPKKMDQIEKEVDNEQMMSMQANSTPMSSRKDDRGSNNKNNPGSSRKYGGNANSEDGWTTPHSRSKFSVQSDKLKSKAPSSAEPLGSQHTFSNWSMGSKPINKGGPVAPAPAPVLVNANAFNVLNTIGEYDSSKHPSSMNMRSNKAYNSKGSSLERSYNRPAYDDVRGAKSGSQHRSRDNTSSSYQHQRNAPQPSKMQSDYTKRPMVPFVQKSVVFAESTGAESVPSQQSMPEPTLAKAASADTSPENVTLDASHYEETFKKALETYTISCSLVECEKQIKTIPTSLLPQLIEDALLSVLDRSKNARLKSGKLYSILIGNGTVLRKDFCERLKSVISEAKDLMIDIPTVWEFLAELVAPLVFENCITLNDLSALLDEESKNRFGSKLLASICRTIIAENDDEKEHAVIGPLLRDSNTKLSNFMPESQIDKFIEENKFHFLNAPRPRISVDLLKRLSKMFADNTPFEEITMWISKNVSDNAVQEYQFIRTLATAIFEFSIVNEKLKAEVLAEKYCYFLRYVDNNPNLELQCLFALQSLINKLEHPQGLLLNICNKLYEDTVFSLESFLAWETNNDPLEQEGKGVTLKQLTAFFVDLKDNEYSSASEDA